MRECAICKETYDPALKECPYCGCPADFLRPEQTGFSAGVRERFDFLSCEDTLDPPAWRVREKKTGQVSVLRALPAKDKGSAFARTLQRLQSAKPRHIAGILEVHPSDDPADSWYRYEDTDLCTIRRMLETENPIGEDQAKRIAGSMRDLMQELEKYSYRHGCLTPDSFSLNGDGILLREFGDGTEHCSDMEQIGRIGRRMCTGSWEEMQEAAGRGGIRSVVSRLKGLLGWN